MSKKNASKVSNKTTRVYEVTMPVKETWIFEVSASSRKEALELYYDHDQSAVNQICSLGGWPKGSRGELKIRELKK